MDEIHLRRLRRFEDLVYECANLARTPGERDYAQLDQIAQDALASKLDCSRETRALTGASLLIKNHSFSAELLREIWGQSHPSEFGVVRHRETGERYTVEFVNGMMTQATGPIALPSFFAPRTYPLVPSQVCALFAMATRDFDSGVDPSKQVFDRIKANPQIYAMEYYQDAACKIWLRWQGKNTLVNCS